jgi:hypothetical protein
VPEPEETKAPLTSFGTGGLPFDVAESRTSWTLWKSLVVSIVGLAGVALGINGGSPGLAIASGLVVVTGAVWAGRFWGSQRDARRLERKAAGERPC